MGWYVGWNYRKSITLSRASGAVTNYQMKVLVGESSGSTGYDVHCGGNIQADFDDLRFTTSNGYTSLHYWIESISGTTPNQTATVWVKFDSIGTSATTFYMYYGNSAATASSSGSNTFIFFDDFERGNDEDAIGGAWTNASGTAKIDTAYSWNGTRSGRLYNTNNIIKNITPGENIAVAMRAYKGDAEGITFRLEHSTTRRAIIKWDADENIWYVPASGIWTTLSIPASHSNWHKFEFTNFNTSASTYDLYLDDARIADDLEMGSGTGLTAGDLYLYGRTASEYSWYDTVYVRNFRATGPAWGSWGDEYGVTTFNDSCIKLVLHGNNTDDSTSIIDSAWYHHAITSNGGAKNENTQKKFGPGSLYFDGDAYASWSDSTNIVFGTDAFCLEAWVYVTSTPASTHFWPIWYQGDGATKNEYYNFSLYYDGTHIHPWFTYNTGGGAYEIGAYWGIESISLNTWTHVAATRDYSGYTRLFVNGALDGVTASPYTTALSNLTYDHWVGKNITTYYTDYTIGYIDEFAITIGTPKWTAAFTPPTAEYLTVIDSPLATIHYTGNAPTYANVSLVPLATITYTPYSVGLQIEKRIPRKIISINTHSPTLIGKQIDRSRVGLNLKGKHLTLKFQNNTAGDGVYLQDIMAFLSEYKRSQSNTMNVKGGHLSLKFQNAASEALFLDYLDISELGLYEGR